jgi:dTDP-4-dehydrorhamnose reductase
MWLLNRDLPRALADHLKDKPNTKLIHFTTDCVFEGFESEDRHEKAQHSANDVYGKSKSQGEVIQSNILNIRASFVGIEKLTNYSLLSWFLSKENGAKVEGYTNHLWNGVTTVAISRVILGIIRNNPAPYFDFSKIHLIPADKVSKWRLLHLIREIFGRNDLEILAKHTDVGVDRVLTTLYPKTIELLWNKADYFELPTISDLLIELRDEG